jgi:hypothetical protein
MTARETNRPIAQRVPAWLLMAVSASVVNLILYAIASAAGFIDAGTPRDQVTAITVVLGSVIGALGAAGVNALVRRMARNPNGTFRIIATAFLIVSLASPLSIAGASTALVVKLYMMHVVVWAISLATLTAQGRES